MSLYLASLDIGFVKDLITKETVVGFVPTAGEVYDDPFFVRDDRHRIGKLGCPVIDINISESSTELLIEQINSTSLLFVAGGNTFYLMQRIREKKLADTIIDYIASKKAYVGASAGAAICSPSIEPFKALDDPTKAPGLSNYKGLDLLEFVVLPHYGNKKYLPRYHKILEENAEQYRFVLLHDDEVMIPTTRTDYMIRKTCGFEL